MDMSKSYRSAVKKIFSEDKIVFDRFHVMQIANRGFNKVRIRQQKGLNKSSEDYRVLKGSKFLFLSNYDNLEPRNKTRLELILETNYPLAVMHLMKEQLREFWNKPTRKCGRRFLATWIMDALEAAEDYKDITGSTVLEPLRKLARTLISHMKGLLNYFDHRISNGKIEGINNKIKTLKRQAYGYRDNEYFKLRLLHLHTQKTQLSG